MTFRVSAGVIAMDAQRRVALVRHVKAGHYDFWVAPGGGVESGEDLDAAALPEDLSGKLVFPPILQCDFWDALEADFPDVILMPFRRMTFE